MSNLAMYRAIKSGECLDLEKLGTPCPNGTWELVQFVDGKDYCHGPSESWVWSIGRRLTDGKIFASFDSRFYMNPEFECLFLR